MATKRAGAVCANCGEPIEITFKASRWASFWWLAIPVIILIPVLIGVISDEEGEAEPTEVPVAEEPAEVNVSIPIKVGSTNEKDGIRLTINDVLDPWLPQSETSEEEPLTPAEGTRFVAIDLTVENNGTADLYYPCYYPSLVDSGNFVYQERYAVKEPALAAGELGSDQKTRGWVTFEVDENASLATLSCSTTTEEAPEE